MDPEKYAWVNRELRRLAFDALGFGIYFFVDLVNRTIATCFVVNIVSTMLAKLNLFGCETNQLVLFRYSFIKNNKYLLRFIK